MGLENALGIILCSSPTLHQEFLAVLGCSKCRLEATLCHVLQFVPNIRHAYTTLLVAHCVRVGTTSALTKLGLTEPQLKSWIGWAPASAIWAEYVHNPSYMPAEVSILYLFMQ